MEKISIKRELFRFTTIGSVDNGKSTLIGRLLYDSKAIYADQYNELENLKDKWQMQEINLAHLTDGLKKEREEGITIDVAYRYFSTPKRKFIIADSPGHLEYTKNMVTGSSNANAALILIDVQKGLDEQTKRHTIISSLLRIPHIIVCINKMDKVNYDKEYFEEVKQQYIDFSSKLRFSDVRFIPVSALKGDNIVKKSANMPWYEGSTLMYNLENMYFSSDKDLVNCRFPVQTVIENNDIKYIGGTIVGGVFKTGDEAVILPLNKIATIKKIILYNKEIKEAFVSMSVLMQLDVDYKIERGDMIARPNNKPQISNRIDAMICWFDENSDLDTFKDYFIMINNKTVNIKIEKVLYKLNIDTLHRITNFHNIKSNDIARIVIKAEENIFYDSYSKNRETGSFILIDKQSNNTVAAGMIR
ncbi:MAG TPA: GTP-binding protein [Bacteroidetes bacterium]|nr:GTP-binding protein [Bacteroidota bacterium]